MEIFPACIPCPVSLFCNFSGANLLILDATLAGFISAAISGCASLFYLSTGIVGFLRGPFSILERALLIAAAIIMAFNSLEFSAQGILPLVIGAVVVVRNIMKYRRQKE